MYNKPFRMSKRLASKSRPPTASAVARPSAVQLHAARAARRRFLTRAFCNQKTIRNLNRISTIGYDAELQKLSWSYVALHAHETHDAFLDALQALLRLQKGSLRISKDNHIDVAKVHFATQCIVRQRLQPSPDFILQLCSIGGSRGCNACDAKCHCVARMVSSNLVPEPSAIDNAKGLAQSLIVSFQNKVQRIAQYEGYELPKGYIEYTAAVAVLQQQMRYDCFADISATMQTVAAGALQLNVFVRSLVDMQPLKRTVVIKV
jgi:hypothetical protein